MRCIINSLWFGLHEYRYALKRNRNRQLSMTREVEIVVMLSSVLRLKLPMDTGICNPKVSSTDAHTLEKLSVLHGLYNFSQYNNLHNPTQINRWYLNLNGVYQLLTNWITLSYWAQSCTDSADMQSISSLIQCTSLSNWELFSHVHLYVRSRHQEA